MSFPVDEVSEVQRTMFKVCVFKDYTENIAVFYFQQKQLGLYNIKVCVLLSAVD